MFLIVLIITFFLNYSPILASDRNIFGLHLADVSDISQASKVINSEQGDWGYATIVIRLNQLDKGLWQEFFDKCRQNHIIPIIRLSTTMIDNYWKKPDFSDIDNLANFLNTLNWPVKNRYIILFNEVNHGSEWGGETDTKNYTDTAIYTVNKFKNLSSDYFILGGAFDLSAPEKPPQFKGAANFLREIYLYKPEYFSLIDGWASHSYPNHGFIGLPTDKGQHSILGYQWELNQMKSLGVNKEYPIFITETGWPHREGQTKANNYYTLDTSAKFLISAFDIWNRDSRVVAVTPFIYNFPYPPFDHFSWVDTKMNLYPSYQRIVALQKKRNTPEQITSYKIRYNNLPFILFTGKEYLGQVVLENTGQSIWSEKPFCLEPQSTENVILEAICTDDSRTEPGQSQTFNYKIKINQINNNGKTYLGWKNLPQLEIAPVSGFGKIYSPKSSTKDKLSQFIRNLFN